MELYTNICIDFIARYVPSNDQSGTASLTLDYSMDNWATGMIGQGMGISGSEVFVQRGQNYRNSWDPTTQYFCPRNSNGVRNIEAFIQIHAYHLADI